MKVFIVFISLLMVFSCLCFHVNDMAEYKQLNVNLKVLADEAACGGGLMTGSSSVYSNAGINENDAKKYVDFVISCASKKPIFSDGSLCASELLVSGASITVTLSYTPNHNIFHIIDAKKAPISQTSTYEWVVSTVSGT